MHLCVVLIPVSFRNNACTAAHLYGIVIVFKSSMYMKRRRSVHFYTLFYNIIQIVWIKEIMLQQISGESAVGAACSGIFFKAYIVYEYSAPYISIVFDKCKKITFALIIYKVLKSGVIYTAFF